MRENLDPYQGATAARLRTRKERSVCSPEMASAFKAGPCDVSQSAVAERISCFGSTASELSTDTFVQTSGPDFYRLP